MPVYKSFCLISFQFAKIVIVTFEVSVLKDFPIYTTKLIQVIAEVYEI